MKTRTSIVTLLASASTLQLAPSTWAQQSYNDTHVFCWFPCARPANILHFQGAVTWARTRWCVDADWRFRFTSQAAQPGQSPNLSTFDTNSIASPVNIFSFAPSSMAQARARNVVSIANAAAPPYFMCGSISASGLSAPSLNGCFLGRRTASAFASSWSSAVFIPSAGPTCGRFVWNGGWVNSGVAVLTSRGSVYRRLVDPIILHQLDGVSGQQTDVTMLDIVSDVDETGQMSWTQNGDGYPLSNTAQNAYFKAVADIPQGFGQPRVSGVYEVRVRNGAVVSAQATGYFASYPLPTTGTFTVQFPPVDSNYDTEIDPARNPSVQISTRSGTGSVAMPASPMRACDPRVDFGAGAMGFMNDNGTPTEYRADISAPLGNDQTMGVSARRGEARVGIPVRVPPGASQDLQGLHLMAYQPNLPASVIDATINGAYAQIYQVLPSGLEVPVSGDNSTNVIAAGTGMAGINRVLRSNPLNDSRRLQHVTLDLDATLAPGEFVVYVSLSASSNALPIEVVPSVFADGQEAGRVWTDGLTLSSPWLDTGSGRALEACAIVFMEPTVGHACDSIDFNNDGLFPDTQDIDDFLSVFGGGACSNDPNCNDIDFNNDGLFPDTLDIDSFLSVFGGGQCL
jgi:hypothetical protein